MINVINFPARRNNDKLIAAADQWRRERHAHDGMRLATLRHHFGPSPRTELAALEAQAALVRVFEGAQ